MALVVCLLVAGLPLATVPAVAANPEHLVISEVVTGGASASDELIELYNPTGASLPLEGLELVYVSASGATVSRRAAWAIGAPSIPPLAHLLVANEAGVYAAIADAVYTTGMAATGGSVALRIQGATTAVDAVGWGTATGTWLEGSAAAAPPAGSSIERLPGGAFGSGQDTDDNATDFVVRTVPDPQNSGSSPTPEPGSSPTQPPPTPAPSSDAPTPSATATATPVSTPPATPTGTPTVAPTPSPAATMDLATARSLPDGTSVTIEGVALTASDFADGGGYVADATAGIAVLVTDGSFARGELLRIRGTLDDRYAQRTIRAVGADILPLGAADPPLPGTTTTGAVGEAVEGSLVFVSGTIVSGPTALTSGPAYDIDDGSGSVRVLVATATGIDTIAWDVGTTLDLVAVVGQRDSSGTGQAGYRLQPRDPDDVLSVTDAPASPSASPSAVASPTPDPSASEPALPGTISIADARQADKNARVIVRGVVTLPTGVVDEGTAVIQDATGAIVLRLGDDAGALSRGRLVDVSGARSTKSGMETIRVTAPPTDRGSAAEPAPVATRTDQVGEALEARLVVVRGAVDGPRRAASGTVSFDVDDGSGPLRVVATAATGFDDELSAGDWVEVVGILGQETTGAQPLRGYRLWPREASDVRVTASPTTAARAGSNDEGDGASTSDPERGSGPAMLGAIGPGGAVRGDLEIGATLVATAWPELAVAGLLWDGERLVAIDARAAAVIDRSVADVAPPLALRLTALEAIGVDEATGIGVVTTRAERVSAGGRLAPPATALPAPGQAPRWVSLVGHLSRDGDRATTLTVTGAGRIPLSPACAAGLRLGDATGQVAVSGIGLAAPSRIVVGCGGIRPAPALSGRAPVTPSSSPQQAVLTGSSVAAPLSPVTDDRRLTASLVLAVGLFGVVAATLARALERRRRAEPAAGGDGTEDADPDEGLDDEGALAGAGPTRVPTLTLVAVPRERGP